MVYCPALIGQLNGTGWFNPIDEGNSSKGGRGYFSVKALTQAPTLRLPYPEKAFQLYVHKNDGIGLGVLSQRLGPEPQPVAIQEAGPNHWGWPPCLWNLAATAVLIEDALKLSLGGKLTIFMHYATATWPPFWPKLRAHSHLKGMVFAVLSAWSSQIFTTFSLYDLSAVSLAFLPSLNTFIMLSYFLCGMAI